eukprot:14231-Heterococcus_DN1.PRE.1
MQFTQTHSLSRDMCLATLCCSANWSGSYYGALLRGNSMLIIPVLTVIAFILHPDGLTWIILNLLTTSVVRTHQRLGFPLCMFWCLVVWSIFILARRRRSATDDSAHDRDKHHARSSSEHAGSRSGRKGRKKGHVHNTITAAAASTSRTKKSTAHDARNSTTSTGSSGSNAKRSSSRNDADMVMPLYDTSNSMQQRQQQYEHDEHHNEHSASSSSSSDGDSSHSDSDNDADDVVDTPCQNDSHSGSTSTAAAATNSTSDMISRDTNTAVKSSIETATADAATAKAASRGTLAGINKPLSQRSNSLPSVMGKSDAANRTSTAHAATGNQSKQQYSSTLQQQQYQHRSRPTYQKQSFANRSDSHQKYRHNSDGNVNVHRQQQYHFKAANNVSQRSPVRPLHNSRPYSAVRSQQWHGGSTTNNTTATSASPRTPVRSTDISTSTSSIAATRSTATLDGRSYKAVSSPQSAVNTAATAGAAVGTSVAECMQTCSLEQLLLYGGLDSEMSNRLATVCNGDAALLLQLVEADYAMLQVTRTAAQRARQLATTRCQQQQQQAVQQQAVAAATTTPATKHSVAVASPLQQQQRDVAEQQMHYVAPTKQGLQYEYQYHHLQQFTHPAIVRSATTTPNSSSSSSGDGNTTSAGASTMPIGLSTYEGVTSFDTLLQQPLSVLQPVTPAINSFTTPFSNSTFSNGSTALFGLRCDDNHSLTQLPVPDNSNTIAQRQSTRVTRSRTLDNLINDDVDDVVLTAPILAANSNSNMIAAAQQQRDMNTSFNMNNNNSSSTSSSSSSNSCSTDDAKRRSADRLAEIDMRTIAEQMSTSILDFDA